MEKKLGVMDLVSSDAPYLYNFECARPVRGLGFLTCERVACVLNLHRSFTCRDCYWTRAYLFGPDGLGILLFGIIAKMFLAFGHNCQFT